MNLHKTGRLALVTATSGFMVGVAFLTGGSSNAIGGLCNGSPASHTWLDASGQYGPALIDGTDHDDTIIGSDGDDILDGAAGDDRISGGRGDDAIRGDTGDDDLDGGPGVDTVVGDGGNDTVAGGRGSDMLYGGSGDDVMIGSDDNEEDKIEAGDDFDVCLFGPGDELGDCEY
jgi:Ca2+-binding RTX toxin-like protein